MRFIALQLRRLFLDHDCVVVPGLGGFVFHVVPARYDADARVLVPPGREVVFNPRLIHNDGVLAHALAVDAGLPYAEALAVVEQEAAAMRNVLAAGEPVILTGVGRLYRADEGVRFVVDAELERVLRTFGLQRIPLIPCAGLPELHPAEPVGDLVHTETPVVPFRRQLLRVAAVLALPVTVGAALWLGTGAPADRFGWTVSPADATAGYLPRFSVEALALPSPPVDAVYDAAWAGDQHEITFHFRSEQVSERGVRIVDEAVPPAAPVMEPMAPVTAAVAAAPEVVEEAPFEVVVGAFAVSANAERLAHRLALQGRPARTSLREDGMTLVVWGGYAEFTAAESARFEAAESGFGGAWVRRLP